MMIMRRGISRWFMQIGVLASALVLFACTKIMAEEPSYVDAINLIKRSVITTALLQDGKVLLIFPNGMLMEAEKLPSLELPSAIGGGKNIRTVNVISVVAMDGSPIKVVANFGSHVVCFLIEEHDGHYIGPCP